MANAEIMWTLQHQSQGYGSVADTHQTAADVPSADRLRPLRELSHDDEAGRVLRTRRVTLAFALAALALIVIGIVANTRTSAVASANPYLDGPSILYSSADSDQSIELRSTVGTEAEVASAPAAPKGTGEPHHSAQQPQHNTKQNRVRSLSLRASQLSVQQNQRRQLR